MTEALSLRVWDESAGELQAIPLAIEGPGSLEMLLRGLAGSSALHLEILRDGEVGHRFEVAAAADDLVPVHLEWTADDRIGLRSPGRRVLSLPGDARYAPAPPIRAPGGEGAALDLVLVIDATSRVWVEGGKDARGGLRLLLGQPEAREAQVEMLVAVAEGLAGSTDLAIGVVAFGDHEMPEVRAPDLRPEYLLHPPSAAESRPFRFDSAGLRSTLAAIPPTTGGDFVDALAEALDRCAELPWRAGSRRVVLLVGDSPGYSLLSPAPPGANGCARSRVVETEADRLHRRGVEIATLYRPPPEEAGHETLYVASKLAEHAAAQYRALASHPGVAWGLGSIDPEEMVRRLLDVPAVLARGAAYPLRVDEGAGASP